MNKRKYTRPAGHFPQTKEGWQAYLNQLVDYNGVRTDGFVEALDSRVTDAIYKMEKAMDALREAMDSLHVILKITSPKVRMGIGDDDDGEI